MDKDLVNLKKDSMCINRSESRLICIDIESLECTVIINMMRYVENVSSNGRELIVKNLY